MKQQNVWLTMVAIALVAAALGGCAANENNDDVAPSAEAPTSNDEGSSDDGDDEQGPAATVARDPALPFSVDDAQYQADAEPLLGWGTPFPQGSYRTGAVGTPMSFTTTGTLSTQSNGGGFFAITDVSSRAPDDRELSFIRAGAFSDPAAPYMSIDDQVGWPSNDFRGWLANIHDGVIATDPITTSVNGLPAIRVDLELSDVIECGFVPGSCVGLLTNNGQDFKALNPNSSYRVWVVEQGDHDPLVITAAIARGEDDAWFERADAVLDTVAFGDIAPNPAQWLSAGTMQLNALGGVDVELPDNLGAVNQWSRTSGESMDRSGVCIHPHHRPARRHLLLGTAP